MKFFLSNFVVRGVLTCQGCFRGVIGKDHFKKLAEKYEHEIKLAKYARYALSDQYYYYSVTLNKETMDANLLVTTYYNDGVGVITLIEQATAGYEAKVGQLAAGKELSLFKDGIYEINFGRCLTSGGDYGAKVVDKVEIKFDKPVKHSWVGPPTKFHSKEGRPLMKFESDGIYPAYTYVEGFFLKGKWQLVSADGNVCTNTKGKSSISFKIGHSFDSARGLAFWMVIEDTGKSHHVALFSVKGDRWVFREFGVFYTMSVERVKYRVGLDLSGDFLLKEILSSDKNEVYTVKMGESELVNESFPDGISVLDLVDIATEAYEKKVEEMLPEDLEIVLFQDGKRIHCGQFLIEGGQFVVKKLQKVKVADAEGVGHFQKPSFPWQHKINQGGETVMLFAGLPGVFPAYAFVDGKWKFRIKGDLFRTRFVNLWQSVDIDQLGGFGRGLAFAMHVVRGEESFVLLFTDHGDGWLFDKPGRFSTMTVDGKAFTVGLNLNKVFVITEKVDE